MYSFTDVMGEFIFIVMSFVLTKNKQTPQQTYIQNFARFKVTYFLLSLQHFSSTFQM